MLVHTQTTKFQNKFLSCLSARRLALQSLHPLQQLRHQNASWSLELAVAAPTEGHTLETLAGSYLQDHASSLAKQAHGNVALNKDERQNILAPLKSFFTFLFITIMKGRPCGFPWRSWYSQAYLIVETKQARFQYEAMSCVLTLFSPARISARESLRKVKVFLTRIL